MIDASRFLFPGVFCELSQSNGRIQSVESADQLSFHNFQQMAQATT